MERNYRLGYPVRALFLTLGYLLVTAILTLVTRRFLYADGAAAVNGITIFNIFPYAPGVRAEGNFIFQLLPYLTYRLSGNYLLSAYLYGLILTLLPFLFLAAAGALLYKFSLTHAAEKINLRRPGAQLLILILLISLMYQFVISESVISETLVILAAALFLINSDQAKGGCLIPAIKDTVWILPALIAALFYEFFVWVPSLLLLCYLAHPSRKNYFGAACGLVRIYLILLFAAVLFPPVSFWLRINSAPWLNLRSLLTIQVYFPLILILRIVFEPVSKLYKNKIPLMIFVFSVFSRYLPL